MYLHAVFLCMARVTCLMSSYDVHSWLGSRTGIAGMRCDRAAHCTQSLHYGMGCFEGMKAYAGTEDGLGRLFRPDMNMARLQRSTRRLMLADFDPQASWANCRRKKLYDCSPAFRM